MSTKSCDGESARCRAEEGLVAVADAMELMKRTEEYMWEAELARIEGELRRLQGASASEIEAHFQRALTIARGQSAKAFELRGAIGLARLWRIWAGATRLAISLSRSMAGSPKGPARPI
jgi:predicted ATPase